MGMTSAEHFSPMENILALETMKEGHDGSGMGLVMKGIGGEFKDLSKYPVLSGSCSESGYGVLQEFMSQKGFKELHSWSPIVKPMKSIKSKDHYFAKVYDYPDGFKEKSIHEKEDLLMTTRIALRRMGESDESIIAYSFYPDIVTLKEVGDPLELGEFFGLDKDPIKAKIVLAQGRQNTNYAINLYACHPFFIQGFASMTNGENTAFVPIREYLSSRGLPGYIGYQSDSEVFTHILHYTVRQLKYPLTYYKDIITPLQPQEIQKRDDSSALKLMKTSLRMLTIDGPNCVIGFLPDGSTFMVQDSKKLRPGVVGGVKGKYALSSEECGVDKAIPSRERSKDVFPMKYDMVIISPDAQEMKVWNQQTGAFGPSQTS